MKRLIALALLIGGPAAADLTIHYDETHVEKIAYLEWTVENCGAHFHVKGLSEEGGRNLEKLYRSAFVHGSQDLEAVRAEVVAKKQSFDGLVQDFGLPKVCQFTGRRVHVADLKF